MIRLFWNDTRGATAIEYAIVAGLISIVIVGAVRQVGLNLNNMYFAKVVGNLT